MYENPGAVPGKRWQGQVCSFCAFLGYSILYFPMFSKSAVSEFLCSSLLDFCALGLALNCSLILTTDSQLHLQFCSAPNLCERGNVPSLCLTGPPTSRLPLEGIQEPQPGTISLAYKKTQHPRDWKRFRTSEARTKRNSDFVVTSYALECSSCKESVCKWVIPNNGTGSRGSILPVFQKLRLAELAVSPGTTSL